MIMTETAFANIEQQVQALVGDVRNLPTPPVVFTQINRVIDNEDASVYDVAGIIAEDPAMSAQVLRLANSAYYGLTNPVPHVKQAVVVLGLNEVKNVVLAASALAAFRKSSADIEYQDEFWRHSLAVAVTARMLLRSFRADKLIEAETAFSAGLLHDIGKMVIHCYAAAHYQKIRQYLKEYGGPDCRAELEVMGLDHCRIGGYLARRWKLPADIMEAISFHHAPPATPEAGSWATIVHVADAFAHKTFDHVEEDDHPPEILHPEYLDRLGVSPDDFDRFKGVIIEEYAKSETFLHMACT